MNFAAPALVLLHAFPVDGRIWIHQARDLAPEFNVFVPDLRGFGSAAAEAAGVDLLSVDSAAADIAQLLDRMAIRKAAIAGISRGGYIAMSFARQFPDRLSALLLLSTRATPADEKERAGHTAMAERVRREGVGFVPEAMKSRLFGPTSLQKRPDVIAHVEKIILDQQPSSIAAAALGMADRPDARPGLEHRHVPVFTLSGTEDGAFEETRAIPSDEFVPVEGAAHLSILEEPGVVTEAMRGFLRKSL